MSPRTQYRVARARGREFVQGKIGPKSRLRERQLLTSLRPAIYGFTPKQIDLLLQVTRGEAQRLRITSIVDLHLRNHETSCSAICIGQIPILEVAQKTFVKPRKLGKQRSLQKDIGSRDQNIAENSSSLRSFSTARVPDQRNSDELLTISTQEYAARAAPVAKIAASRSGCNPVPSDRRHLKKQKYSPRAAASPPLRQRAGLPECGSQQLNKRGSSANCFATSRLRSR